MAEKIGLISLTSMQLWFSERERKRKREKDDFREKNGWEERSQGKTKRRKRLKTLTLALWVEDNGGLERLK